MKFELDIGDERKGSGDLLVLPGEGTLGEYAEFMRRHLDCTAVVVTIAEPFVRLFDGGTAGDAPASNSQVCALAPDTGGAKPADKALDDPRRLADPVAARDMGFGFYAGLPLRLSSGRYVGMLTAVDSAARSLAANELATLKMLANIVVQIIEFRLATGGWGKGGAART